MDEYVSPEGMHDRGIITKRLKRKKRKRIALRLTSILLLFGIIGITVFFLIKKVKDNTFSIKHVMVVGNETVNSKTVIEAARIPVDTCIFTVEMNQLYQNVSERIDCRYLLISKKFPDTILVNIEEYPVFFAVINNNQVYYLDENFRIVEISDYLMRNDIPLVSGLTGLEKMEAGMTVDLNPASSAEDVRKILTILTNSGYDDRLSEIIVNSDKTFRIITKNNMVIHVAGLEQFINQYDYIGSIIEKNKSNLDVDLTLGNEAIVKNR